MNNPVVLTGSMRPATSLSGDGAMNLYQAICLANTDIAVRKGVLTIFLDNNYVVRTVTKTSTYNVMAISVADTGC